MAWILLSHPCRSSVSNVTVVPFSSMTEVNFRTSHGKTVSTTHPINSSASGFCIARENSKDQVSLTKACLAGYGQNCPHTPNQLERCQIGSYISQEKASVLLWPHPLYHIQSPHKHPLILGIDQHL